MAAVQELVQLHVGDLKHSTLPGVQASLAEEKNDQDGVAARDVPVNALHVVPRLPPPPSSEPDHLPPKPIAQPRQPRNETTSGHQPVQRDTTKPPSIHSRVAMPPTETTKGGTKSPPPSVRKPPKEFGCRICSLACVVRRAVQEEEEKEDEELPPPRKVEIPNVQLALRRRRSAQALAAGLRCPTPPDMPISASATRRDALGQEPLKEIEAQQVRPPAQMYVIPGMSMSDMRDSVHRSRADTPTSLSHSSVSSEERQYIAAITRRSCVDEDSAQDDLGNQIVAESTRLDSIDPTLLDNMRDSILERGEGLERLAGEFLSRTVTRAGSPRGAPRMFSRRFSRRPQDLRADALIQMLTERYALSPTPDDVESRPNSLRDLDDVELALACPADLVLDGEDDLRGIFPDRDAADE